MISKIYENFIAKGKEDFVTEDVLEFLKENPQIEKLNAKFMRNEGLVKSLANDIELQIEQLG